MWFPSCSPAPSPASLYDKAVHWLIELHAKFCPNQMNGIEMMCQNVIFLHLPEVVVCDAQAVLWRELKKKQGSILWCVIVIYHISGSISVVIESGKRLHLLHRSHWTQLWGGGCLRRLLDDKRDLPRHTNGRISMGSWKKPWTGYGERRGTKLGKCFYSVGGGGTTRHKFGISMFEIIFPNSRHPPMPHHFFELCRGGGGWVVSWVCCIIYQ